MGRGGDGGEGRGGRKGKGGRWGEREGEMEVKRGGLGRFTVNDERIFVARVQLLNVRTAADDPNGDPSLANLAKPTHVRPPTGPAHHQQSLFWSRDSPFHPPWDLFFSETWPQGPQRTFGFTREAGGNYTSPPHFFSPVYSRPASSHASSIRLEGSLTALPWNSRNFPSDSGLLVQHDRLFQRPR